MSEIAGAVPAGASSPANHDAPRYVAFIQACWHKDIVDKCRDAFAEEIMRLGEPPTRIRFFEVPGSFEIPLHAKLLAKTGEYAAIVAAGFVVNGGIYRHEFVASAVINALMQVQLEIEIPVLSAVLTPQQFHEHEVHQKFFSEHMLIKGVEAAQACVAVLRGVTEIKASMAGAGSRLRV